MELRHLRYFVAVAEELHFRRAAERLHISQPPLSQQIRALERELGVELLVRSRRRVELTAAGAALLDEAREVLADVDAATDRVRRVARGEIGALAVGFVGSALYGPVPEILRAFRTRSPEVELLLREIPSAAQVDALLAGRIQVGFLRPVAEHPGLEMESIHREDVMVALPEDHPAARARQVALADLRGEGLVLLSRRESPGLYAALADAMAQIAPPGGAVQEVAEMQTVVGLVAAGMGVALVPASLAGLERRGVAYRPLRGEDHPKVDLALAWRADDHSPVVQSFLALARELAAAT